MQTEEVIELDDAITIDRKINNVQAYKIGGVSIGIEKIEGHTFRCVYPTFICQQCNEFFQNS